MSATKSKTGKKATNILAVILLLTFLAVIGVTAFSIINVTSTVETSIFTSKNGVPDSWSNYEQKATISSEVSSRIVNDDYVQYTTSLKNNSNTEPLSVTHFASYIDGNKDSGFVPLSSNYLEYTYTPDNADSWTPVGISAPSNDDGSKLDHNIYVGVAGSKVDTIYFRYNIDMAEDDGLVDNITSYVAESKDGSTNIATSFTTTEYNPISISSTAEAGDATDESGEYVKPLGVSSESFPTSGVISHLATAAPTSKDSLTTSIVIIFAAVGVFIVGLAAYLIFCHHASAKKH